MPGSLTILAAISAGLLSFLSPCVLPLVPAYVGQLTGATVASGAAGRPSRWVALSHAIAYVAGFGLVFTLLGVTATLVGDGIAGSLPVLREVGGVLVILLGLNLAGLLPVPTLSRTWRPLAAGASLARAEATGSLALQAPGGGAGFGDRVGGRLAGSRYGWLSSFGLGVVFGVGWTPCIGPVLGAIITVAATTSTVVQGGVLLFAYTLGLGLPFLAMGLAYERASGLLRPLVRHGRLVSALSGLLVVALGVALLMDWLAILARYAPGV